MRRKYDWEKRIKKVEESSDWDELPASYTIQKSLGRVILEDFLTHDGDVIEVKIAANGGHRGVASLLRSITMANKQDHVEFV